MRDSIFQMFLLHTDTDKSLSEKTKLLEVLAFAALALEALLPVKPSNKKL